MRIGLVHSFYRGSSPSGENIAVLDQKSVLETAGHEVLLVSKRTDDYNLSIGYRMRAAVSVMTGVGGDPTPALKDFDPDVIHVHNLFPNFGTDWLNKWDGPVVSTLHNYRPLCANGLLFRYGRVCTLCPDGSRTSAARFGCYQGSRLASLPFVVRGFGYENDPLLQRANRIVALTQIAADLYRRYGVPDGKITVIPNFVLPASTANRPTVKGTRWLAVGRFSSEKGFVQLISDWSHESPLDIIGEGPQLGCMQEAARGKNVRILGRMDRDVLRAKMTEYTGIVVPSRWFEGFPQVVLEAMEAGLPVIALEGSGASSAVRELGIGLTYSTPHELSAGLTTIEARQSELQERGRAIYRANFHPEVWLNRIETLYRVAVEAQR